MIFIKNQVKELLVKIPLEVLYVLIALVIAIYIHEFGHFMAAKNYQLDARFGIDKEGFFVETFSQDPFINAIINHSGPIMNLIISFLGLASILIIPKVENVKTLLIVISMTNILVALISLTTFAYTGVL
ncbi:hypothetical protein J4471_05545 [Candidatus Woesearchaeota archaeon]|nr:hypothetical protein [Candidatus Woesearchaeota archaeon]